MLREMTSYPIVHFVNVNKRKTLSSFGLGCQSFFELDSPWKRQLDRILHRDFFKNYFSKKYMFLLKTSIIKHKPKNDNTSKRRIINACCTRSQWRFIDLCSQYNLLVARLTQGFFFRGSILFSSAKYLLHHLGLDF